jgi:phage gp46-like protein
MPARRRYINPTTGDYELSAGGFREDMTPASRVVLRLRTKRGSISGLPRFGSRLYQIRKLTADAKAKAESYVREALDDLARAGELPELAVSATPEGSALRIVVSYRDPDGRKRSIPYLHKVIP